MNNEREDRSVPHVTAPVTLGGGTHEKPLSFKDATVVAVKLEAVEGTEGIFRVPPKEDGGPGPIPPGFAEAFLPGDHGGRVMTRIATPPPIAPEPPAGTPVKLDGPVSGLVPEGYTKDTAGK